MAAVILDKETQKKMIGELLKAADRYIKSTEWNKALEEVNKALAIEPNNMYAMAYKDRINVSIAEEKKKTEDEKVKKLSEDKKAGDKPADAVKEKPSEPVKSAQRVESSTDQSKPVDAAKKEAVKEESKPAAKEEPAAKAKDDSTTRLETLRQEFAATQAKLQRDVAQLTMQVKEAQALKDVAEKNLNAQIAALQNELSSTKQQVEDSIRRAGKENDKELEAVKKELDSIKSKHQKEIETAKEVAKGESLAQIAVLQKELETVKNAAANASFQKQSEDILRSMFQKSWLDGAISADERVLLLVLKSALQMTDAKFSELETAAKGEAYITALRNVWSDDAVTPNESDFLTTLREKLGIPADEHFKLESQIRKELKK